MVRLNILSGLNLFYEREIAGEGAFALKQSFGDKKIIVLDEAQMVTDVGLICKQLVDVEMGIQLILTGSSASNMADLTREPLTGRKWEYFL